MTIQIAIMLSKRIKELEAEVAMLKLAWFLFEQDYNAEHPPAIVQHPASYIDRATAELAKESIDNSGEYRDCTKDELILWEKKKNKSSLENENGKN